MEPPSREGKGGAFSLKDFSLGPYWGSPYCFLPAELVPCSCGAAAIIGPQPFCVYGHRGLARSVGLGRRFGEQEIIAPQLRGSNLWLVSFPHPHSPFSLPQSPFPFSPSNLQTELRETALHLQTKALV